MVSSNMLTSVFVPTNRPGGLDVLENSLSIQSVSDIILIVCDDWGNREDEWYSLAEYCGLEQLILLDPPPIQPPFKRNLARAYNIAAEKSLELGCDLMISLQDYIHIPHFGIERFQYCYDAMPHHLYTGLTSIANTPTVDDIADLEGAYTIFEHPYRRFSQPTDIQWYDVRYYIFEEAMKLGDGVSTDDFNSWEANWAAVPLYLVADGLRWNEEYDQGYAYENNDFARRALKEYGVQVLIDKRNHAISLPHFDYWPQEKIDLKTYSNESRYFESL